MTVINSKHQRQIKDKIIKLKDNPIPNDSKALIGYPIYRCDIGEYRIIYRFDQESIYVALVGKRNDSEVFKIFKRKTGK